MKKIFTLLALTIISSFFSINIHAQTGANDTTFNPGSGFDGGIGTMSIQSDGKIIAGGTFGSFNGTTINNIARLNVDGSLDTFFNPGSGFNGGIWSTAIQSDGKIIAGGNFTVFNGTSRNGIVRLNADGSLDTSFDPGTGFDPGNGSNFWIYSIAIQNDGKTIVGGQFTTFNGITRNCIVRLNSNGSLDNSFNPGSGFDGGVVSISIQTDEKIIAGGSFTSLNGTPRNGMARLNLDGSIDNSLDPGTGFNDAIYSFAIQSDGKIISGGWFTYVNGMPRNRIARLNADGLTRHFL